MLKPLDIVVGLKAHLWCEPSPWSFERLAEAIGIAPSQAHTSLRRLERSGLYRPTDRSLRTHAFTDFATHGMPYVFPVTPGPMAVGMPTAHAAPPLADRIVSAEAYVWANGAGVPGFSIAPLHPFVPAAAAADDALYQSLALVDALRVGRARDRSLARESLETVLRAPGRDARWVAARLAEQRAG